MSVGPNRSSRHAMRATFIVASLLVTTLVTGCATDRAGGQPTVPNEQALDPATSALNQAVDANAEQFAPRSLDAARRRITLARDILFTAARADRQPTDAEQSRLDGLVAAARLDAREALIQTQAGAVQAQLDRLQGGDTSSDDEAAGGAAGDSGMNDGLGGSGLGLGDNSGLGSN